MLDKVHTIVIDPGHGGKDRGAVNGNSGLAEKDVVLKVALRVRDLLDRHQDIKPVMTREDDRYLTLAERADIANQLGAPLQSIHANSGGGIGYEVFTSPGQTESDRWATICLEQYQDTFPDRTMRSDYSDGDPDKEAKFAVLTRTKKEAVLIELEFIDSAAGNDFLADPHKQELMAWSIYLADCRWLGVEPIMLNSSVNQPSNAAVGGLRPPVIVRWDNGELSKALKDLAADMQTREIEFSRFMREYYAAQLNCSERIKEIATELGEGGSEV